MFSNQKKTCGAGAAVVLGRLFDKVNHLFNFYRSEVFAVLEIVADFAPALALAFALIALLKKRWSRAARKPSSEPADRDNRRAGRHSHQKDFEE